MILIDKHNQLDQRREYKGVVQGAMNEYLLLHPNKSEEALIYATGKLEQYINKQKKAAEETENDILNNYDDGYCEISE
ncbi:MAG: hypothetical protein ACHQUC_05320 [Chlamydiales bacterium]